MAGANEPFPRVTSTTAHHAQYTAVAIEPFDYDLYPPAAHLALKSSLDPLTVVEPEPEAADLVLIPCRPAILDLEVITNTLAFLRTTGKPVVVILNAQALCFPIPAIC